MQNMQEKNGFDCHKESTTSKALQLRSPFTTELIGLNYLIRCQAIDTKSMNNGYLTKE